MIHRISDSVPYLRRNLPFVNHSRSLAVKDEIGALSGEQLKLSLPLRVIHKHLAVAMIVSSCRLTTPLRALDNDGADTFQTAF
jgi:hypothetical protein